jgi:hypothetical protein
MRILVNVMAECVPFWLSDVMSAEKIFSDMRQCDRLQFDQICLARSLSEELGRLG